MPSIAFGRLDFNCWSVGSGLFCQLGCSAKDDNVFDLFFEFFVVEGAEFDKRAEVFPDASVLFAVVAEKFLLKAFGEAVRSRA